MIRIVQIALLLAITPFGMAKAQDTVAVGKKLQADWAGCVKLYVQVWSAPPEDFSGPAEPAFRNCATEEQLFIAFISAAAPEASKAILVSHYRDKLAMKKKLTDDHFKAIASALGKQ